MRKSEVPKSIGRLLRKSGDFDRGQSNIVPRKRTCRIAVHEKELAGEMTLLALVIVHIAHKLIIVVGARGTEGGRSICALWSRNDELAVWQFCIQHRQRAL